MTNSYKPLKMPKLLRAGDKVAILATSGPVDPERLSKGLDIVKQMGLNPYVMESCYKKHDYLAGTDEIRLRDLHMAFAAPDVRGIFVARGGYGAARLLPFLDYKMIRHNPKVFLGYSDVTALHIALNQLCGFVTFHGPMVAVDFAGCLAARESLVDNIFENAVNNRLEVYVNIGGALTTIVPGCAVGMIIGGNLSLLAASIGTPYEIETKNRILFIEEINEDAYSIDRMLMQLKQARKLSDVAGILLGDFSPQTREALHICINEIIIPENKPTLAGLSSGHISPNLTLPLGISVKLDTTKQILYRM